MYKGYGRGDEERGRRMREKVDAEEKEGTKEGDPKKGGGDQ